MEERKKFCFVTTVAVSITDFLLEIAEKLHQNGFDVTFICNTDENLKKILPPYFRYIPVPMQRGVNLKSFSAIKKLRKIFKEENFDIIQYTSPNASFYASIAAKQAKTKAVRLYWQAGMVFVTMKGLKRMIFKWIEKKTCKLSSYVMPDSQTILELSRSLGFCDETNSGIVWNGSAKGIDLVKYDITKKQQMREKIVKQYPEIEGKKVIIFVGRMGRDKGCNELLESFKMLKEKHNDIKMFFLGENERPETMKQENLDYFFAEEDIIKTGRVKNVEEYLAASDIFVLPTYREGFGLVILEAEAMGLPIVSTDIPGASSAMQNGITGFAVEAQNTNAIYEATDKLLCDKDLREEFGKNGVKFAVDNFDSKVFMEKMLEHKLMLIEKYGNKNGK